ncbi:MAG TPA: DUF2577 domain-containing protein [Ruminiclostridium sp.]|nr:DUF2577 domain-containing protein [Ruminiclostridium sp.]
MLPNMVEIIKMAAMGAVNDSKPTSIVFGNVVKSDPLAISISQKLTLKEQHLILTSNVKDYDVEMSEVVAGQANDNDSGSDVLSERKKFRVHNGLVAGDCVVMIQMQGGQKFLVLDKVVET